MPWPAPLRTLNAQLALSKETAEIWAKNVEIMKDYKEAGRVNQAAVVQSQAQYWSILASITDLETAVREPASWMNQSPGFLMNEPSRFVKPPFEVMVMPG